MTDASDSDFDLGEIDIDDPDLVGLDHEDLFPDEIPVEGVEIDTFDRSAQEIAELKRAAFDKTVARYAGQLNTIDLANAVAAELEPLSHSNILGTLLRSAMTKLALDVLAGNLKPKSVREATQAIEALEKVRQMNEGGGLDDAMNSDRRKEVFAEIRMRLYKDQPPDQMEQSAREVIDATFSEAQDAQGLPSGQSDGQVQDPEAE